MVTRGTLVSLALRGSLIEQLRYELYARLTELFPDRVRLIRLYSQPRALQIVEIDRSVRVSV